MYHYLLGVTLILLVFGGWILVQHAARAYAARHPELGPQREEGACSTDCGRCSALACHHDLDRSP